MPCVLMKRRRLDTVVTTRPGRNISLGSGRRQCGISDYTKYTSAMLTTYRRNVSFPLVSFCCSTKFADIQYDCRIVVSEDTSQAMSDQFDLSDNMTKPRAFYGRVFVYWKTANVEIMEDEYSCSFMQYLGELGGTWGLVLGMSIISVLELTERLFKVAVCRQVSSAETMNVDKRLLDKLKTAYPKKKIHVCTRLLKPRSGITNQT